LHRRDKGKPGESWGRKTTRLRQDRRSRGLLCRSGRRTELPERRGRM